VLPVLPYVLRIHRRQSTIIVVHGPGARRGSGSHGARWTTV